jgi:hypothetical protein
LREGKILKFGFIFFGVFELFEVLNLNDEVHEQDEVEEKKEEDEQKEKKNDDGAPFVTIYLKDSMVYFFNKNNQIVDFWG